MSDHRKLAAELVRGLVESHFTSKVAHELERAHQAGHREGVTVAIELLKEYAPTDPWLPLLVQRIEDELEP